MVDFSFGSISIIIICGLFIVGVFTTLIDCIIGLKVSTDPFKSSLDNIRPTATIILDDELKQLEGIL